MKKIIRPGMGFGYCSSACRAWPRRPTTRPSSFSPHDNTHMPIIYPTAVTAVAKSDAIKFVDYVRGPIGAAAFKKYGFTALHWSPAPVQGIPSSDSNRLPRKINMKVSARNVLPATVNVVTPGAVDTGVVVELAPGIQMVSIITKQSAEKLELKPGECMDAQAARPDGEQA